MKAVERVMNDENSKQSSNGLSFESMSSMKKDEKGSKAKMRRLTVYVSLLLAGFASLH